MLLSSVVPGRIASSQRSTEQVRVIELEVLDESRAAKHKPPYHQIRQRRSTLTAAHEAMLRYRYWQGAGTASGLVVLTSVLRTLPR